VTAGAAAGATAAAEDDGAPAAAGSGEERGRAPTGFSPAHPARAAAARNARA
jgi:hypothetical protein